MKKINITFLLLLFTGLTVFAQTPKNKGYFKQYKPGYFQNSILKGIDDFTTKTEVAPAPSKSFKIDLTGMVLPNDIDLYKREWSTPPISQGATSTCWCFSTTSYFETEIYRLTKQQVKLSEMYTVYWEYVEKVANYVKQRGNCEFGEGSEGNAVTRIWKKYGVIPESDYNGMKPEQTFQTHDKMFAEIESYLKSIKASNAWNEDIVVSTVKSIMNTYMGVPPTKVTVNGKDMSPQDYLKNVLKLNLDDYIDVTSIMEAPYYEKCEYKVPDNWWHSKDYYNVPLDVYMSIVKKSIRSGYTIAIGGDVSESGFESFAQVAIIPSYDIPSEYIDENARQFRFSNNTTTDDHGLHLVGYYEKDGKDWYLIKDSGSGSRNCGKDSKNFGYYFFHEDYVKLKMMDFMVHKDMMKDVLSKFDKK
ncbi:MAG: peptidase C1 [Bacteroidetes bacterium CG2_30_32_10]|nr:MAG: peptidase C1 [Bacteroidetes bacterium CG2_30_32_10]